MASQVCFRIPNQASPSLSSLKAICLMDDASECLLGVASAVVDPFSTVTGVGLAAALASIVPARISTPAKVWNRRVTSLFFSGVFAAGLFCEVGGSGSMIRTLIAVLLGSSAAFAIFRRTIYPIWENSNTPAHTPPK